MWFNLCKELGKKFLKFERKYQSLKGAVGATLCQNEAELKFSMEISTRIHQQNKQGKSGRLNLLITDIYFL